MSQCMSPLGDLKVLVFLAQLRVRNSERSAVQLKGLDSIVLTHPCQQR